MEDHKIYGRNPVQEALTGTHTIEKIFLLREMTGEYERFIRTTARSQNIPLSKVPQQKLDNLSRMGNHQGVVAIMSPITYSTIENTFSGDLENLELAVILDGITDVRNIGAIARTAVAFNCKGLILTTKNSASINEDAIKASSGALLKLPMIREKNTMIAIEKLQQLGFTVIATDLRAKDYVEDFLVEGPIAIVLGSEEKGVSRETLKIVDHTIKIRQTPEIDSLNVSVATGIVLHELFKKMY